MKWNRYPVRIAALFAIGILLAACTAPWEQSRGEDEEMTLPDTSTVAAVEEAQQDEPERIDEYVGYASVRIAASAVVRLYVDSSDATQTVVAAQGLNPKGESVLAGWDIAGEDYEESVAELAERIVNKGYASDLNARILVEAEKPDDAAAEAYERIAKDAFASCYLEHGIEAQFGDEEETAGE